MNREPMDRYPDKSIDELIEMQMKDEYWNEPVLETLCVRLDEIELWHSGDLFDIGNVLHDLYYFYFEEEEDNDEQK